MSSFTSIAACIAGAGPGEARTRIRQATEELLARAAAENAAQRIYTHILASRAVAAVESPATDPAAPLYGVPVAVKDNIDVEGTETSCGRRLDIGAAPASADIVARLESLGAIIIGKTNLDEAALGASGRNPRFGRCRNPRFVDRLSGGSSSGSAASVAAGHALLGMGTDTLGSVRIPAAFCGIVGFKPSHARLSAKGVAPLHPPFDSIGLLAASLADIAQVAGLLLRDDVPHGISRVMSPDAVRGVLVLDDAALDAVDSDVAADYRACVAMLSAARGIECSVAPPLDWSALARAAFWEVSHQFARRSAAAAPGYHPLHDIDGELARLLAKAANLPTEKLAAGRALIEESASRLERRLAQAAALLTPTCPQNSPPSHEDPANNVAAFTAPANVAGLPAIAWTQRIAAGRTVSLQLTGRFGQDLELLDLAARLQRTLDGSPGITS